MPKVQVPVLDLVPVDLPVATAAAVESTCTVDLARVYVYRRSSYGRSRSKQFSCSTQSLDLYLLYR